MKGRARQSQTVRLSGQPRTLLATTSLQPRLVTAAPDCQALSTARYMSCSGSAAPDQCCPWGCRAQHASRALNLAACQKKLDSQQRSLRALVPQTTKRRINTHQVRGFVFFASSFVFSRTEWGHLSPKV